MSERWLPENKGQRQSCLMMVPESFSLAGNAGGAHMRWCTTAAVTAFHAIQRQRIRTASRASRSRSRSMIALRLSKRFLPRATASSTLA